MQLPDDRLIRIGVFYEGSYFYHVSNYYTYTHERRARISIPGLHQFIRNEIAEQEDVELPFSRIVDAHYFRTRLNAHEAELRHKLLHERVFDDILMREGIVTHYLPLGLRGEGGVDVWMALEAYETAMLKQFNVLVLIAADRSYVPLVRKLNTLGTRVCVLAWDFEYTHQRGDLCRTQTSPELIQEANFPILMHEVIDDPARKNDELIKNLFVTRDERRIPPPSVEAAPAPPPQEEPLSQEVTPAGTEKDEIVDETVRSGIVENLKNGYGFIQLGEEENIFFFWTDVVNVDFNDLQPGDEVEYVLGRNDRGDCAKRVTLLNVEFVDES